MKSIRAGSAFYTARFFVLKEGGPETVEAVRAFGRVAGAPWTDGVDQVIETSGSAQAREWVIPALRREGKAAIVGVGSEERVINPSDIHGRAVTLIGSVVFPLGWSWDFSIPGG